VVVPHYADLPKDDIKVAQGVQVTKPMRTILDLLAKEEAPLSTLRQALREGLRRGLIRRSEVAESKRQLGTSKQARVFLHREAA
jgi:hypothetical protein